MTDLDRETSAAVEALAHRIRVRDAAAREGDDADDPEVFAREFLTALRGRGWRPVEALAPWQHQAEPATEKSREIVEQLRAELERKIHRPAGDAA